MQDPEDCFPYKCDAKTMDLGHVLHSNITESPYFRERCAYEHAFPSLSPFRARRSAPNHTCVVLCRELQDFEAIVDEIYEHVDHLGERHPSLLFFRQA